MIGFDSRFWNMRRCVQTCLHIHDFITQTYLNNTDVNQNSGESFHYVWRLIYARVIGEEICMFLDVTSHPYNILTLKLDNTYNYQDYWQAILFLSVTIFKLDANNEYHVFLELWCWNLFILIEHSYWVCIRIYKWKTVVIIAYTISCHFLEIVTSLLLFNVEIQHTNIINCWWDS